MKYFTQVASTYDALCALLLSLEIAVHEHGVAMEDLEERKEDENCSCVQDREKEGSERRVGHAHSHWLSIWEGEQEHCNPACP